MVFVRQPWVLLLGVVAGFGGRTRPHPAAPELVVRRGSVQREGAEAIDLGAC